jgi:hypothetical protein
LDPSPSVLRNGTTRLSGASSVQPLTQSAHAWTAWQSQARAHGQDFTAALCLGTDDPPAHRAVERREQLVEASMTGASERAGEVMRAACRIDEMAPVGDRP